MDEQQVGGAGGHPGEHEEAWTSFLVRLGDRLAGMGEGEVLVLAHPAALEAARAVHDADPDGPVGAAPYVQVLALDEGVLRLEAVGDAYLDDHLVLTAEQEDLLLGLDWDEPTDDDLNFHGFAAVDEADRAAALLVATMREVWGVPHPAFLEARGLDDDLETDDADEADEVDDDADHAHELVAVVPRTHRHLQQLVDEAMGEDFPDLEHDGDGDIPVRSGASVVFVKVLPDRPAVEVFAELVIDPVDDERLGEELEILNRTRSLWTFWRRDQVVVASHELLAVPFSGTQLRLLVKRLVDEVDVLAGDLVARVGGRRFLDPVPDDAVHETADEGDDGDDGLDATGALALVGLLELCHLGRPREATVAGLFDHDRVALVRQIVRVRTGRADLDGHHVDDVLGALRRGLRWIADGSGRTRSVPPRPRSVQPSLLSDDDAGEETLDLGWPA
ncbi:T3SS (YopN, CesT) and YbjN peptide-binding chaperone 1 [Nocardioides litoris]|uniref:T3SS (YopN, CesT) and YbjN peptide-binding chaperone 1 n=1 Tax=Nocardioides litoris TaxID=1926648 RepID=UPI0011246FEC|nr:hypothetical protein [Nocardioides litoris]